VEAALRPLLPRVQVYAFVTQVPTHPSAVLPIELAIAAREGDSAELDLAPIAAAAAATREQVHEVRVE